MMSFGCTKRREDGSKPCASLFASASASKLPDLGDHSTCALIDCFFMNAERRSQEACRHKASAKRPGAHLHPETVTTLR